MYALLTYKHQFIQFNTMQIKESFQFTNLHAFYQNPMGLQVTLPKTKYSNNNQVSRRSSALVQLNVKHIKAHPIEMDPLYIQLNSTWHHWTVPECHSIAPSGFCHINIELTWVGTSKVVLAVTKPPCSTSSSCPLECKKCWRMFLTRKKAWNLWISESQNLCLGPLEST